MSYSFLYAAVTALGLSAQPYPITPAPATPSATAPKPAETVPVTPVVAPAPAPAPSPGGNFTAHVASYKTEAAAQAGWAQLRGRVPGLASQEPHFLPVNLPDKGTWVRLTAGRGASPAGAAGVCAPG